MSYILEALRKSEQERQRGKVPDLNSFKEESGPVVPRNRILPWAIGAVAVVNLAVILFVWAPWKPSAPGVATIPADTAQPVAIAQISPPPSPVQPAVPVPQPQQPAMQQPVAQQTSQQVPAQQPVQGYPQQVGQMQMAPQPAMQPAQQQPMMPLAPQYAQQQPGYAGQGYGQPAYPQQQAVQGGYPPPQYRQPPPQYQGYQQVQTPNVTIVAPPVQDQTTTVSPAQSGEGEQYIEPYSPDFPASAEPGRSPNVAYMPQLEELPPYERQAIPDMTFSSHMYSSMPRFRSIIINGKRLKEGEYLNDTLQVREITDKGVIMSNGNTLFTVDVLGRWAQ